MSRYMNRKQPYASNANTPQPAGSAPASSQPGPSAAGPVPMPPQVPPGRARPSKKGGDPEGVAKAGRRIEPLHLGLLITIVVLGIALRLKDPLSTNLLPAEDPYLHMERTWDLLQGKGVEDYPLGFMVLLAPFALLGDEVFYLVVRFVPPLFGGAAIVGVFLLAHRYFTAAGALSAALLLAVMPEHIVRTNIMVPAALALAVLPFFFLLLLRFAEGHAASWKPLAAIGGALFIVHPWTLLLMLPPVFAFWLLQLLERKDRSMLSATGVSAGLFGGMAVLWMIWHGNVAGSMFHSATTRFGEIIASPATLSELPPYVDIPYMLTWAAVLLAAIGAYAVLRERNRLGMLALVWTLLLLPLVLVDWFGSGYIPHRTVAYVAIGVAILGGLGVAELLRHVKTPEDGSAARRSRAMLAVLAGIALVTVPGAIGTDPWYRLYDEDDYAAWSEIEAQDASLVMAGSWQANAGYRGLTGEPCQYNPDFFTDANFRAVTVKRNPDLIVLIDNYTHELGTPTGFLQEEGWQLLGEWDDIQAWVRP